MIRFELDLVVVVGSNT